MDLGSILAIGGAAIPAVVGWALKFKQANAIKEIRDVVAAYDDLTNQWEQAKADGTISAEEQDAIFMSTSKVFTELREALDVTTQLIPGDVGKKLKSKIPDLFRRK